MPTLGTPIVVKQYHPTVPAGSVIRTDPPAGTELEEDQVVTLYESLGPIAMMGQIWT